MPECERTTKIFAGERRREEGRGGLVKLGHFNKDYFKNIRKRGSR